MNRELVLHNFPELDFSNSSSQNINRKSYNSSSIILPADKFERDRIPTARKKKIRPRIPEPPPREEKIAVLTP